MRCCDVRLRLRVTRLRCGCVSGAMQDKGRDFHKNFWALRWDDETPQRVMRGYVSRLRAANAIAILCDEAQRNSFGLGVKHAFPLN
jgi:hypothetical protein